MESGQNKQNKQKRILLLLDLAAITAGFFLAVFIRFHKSPGMAELSRIYDGLYYLIFELILAIYVGVFLLNESSRKPLEKQNPFEKVMGVIRNQLFLFIWLVVLLYLIRQGIWASRAIILMLLFFSTVFDSAVRFIYGGILKKKAEKEGKLRRLLLLTEEEGSDVNPLLIKEMAGEGNVITGITDRAHYYTDKGKLEEEQEYDGILYVTDSAEIPVFDKPLYVLNPAGNPPVSSEMTDIIGELPVVRYSGLREKCPVLGVNFSVTNQNEFLIYIRENIENLKGKYICFGNVHTSVMARENEDYRVVQNDAAFIMPDGMPIHREQRKKGYSSASRVAGPDFMKLFFMSAMDGKIPMYFYGSTDETIEGLRENLRKNYPGIDVRGFESPPFRELSDEEDREVVERINSSGAAILWVGLGAPKQEYWMKKHENRINALMLGVGAGFDFHGGTVKRAPVWIQRLGMEWLHRLMQDPKKLLKRYIATNTKFLIYRLFDRR